MFYFLFFLITVFIGAKKQKRWYIPILLSLELQLFFSIVFMRMHIFSEVYVFIFVLVSNAAIK